MVRSRTGARARLGPFLQRVGAHLLFLTLVVLGGAVATSAYLGVPLGELLAHRSTRLAPAPVVTSGGAYAFIETQPGDPAQPVTYNPCRRIGVTHNPAGAPRHADRLLSAALTEVSHATGLAFELTAPTDRRPDRTGSGGAARGPVLVAWSTPEETPGLEGDVAGLGGSTARANVVTGALTYVTGQVVLDGPALADVARQPAGAQRVQAVILHELGHLVGLDHVEDARELMNARNAGRTTFGPGDREGLALLGAGPCRG